ncbi:SRPBCC family protein [Actinomadura hibisca]|uniref:SRPBCC family protein n=1 Tax=Actinomadura hibisca TaxID=68565 RepID=UPI0008348766|nr:carbon monoxide dehydrogenase subunit G [Actinomadura hibisca]
MKVTGSAEVAASRPRVWDALQDPGVLARTIPGCRSMNATGPDSYAVLVSAGVASIKGTYSGTVDLSDLDPPQAFTLRARGQGVPGSVDAVVRVELTEEGDGTRVDYTAEAVVGGMVGGVGQRLLAGVAKKTAGEFFAAVERELTGRAPVPESVPAPGPGLRLAADVLPPKGRIAPPHMPPFPAQRAPLSAFAAGAATALAGVVLGYALGRRR